MSASKFTLYGLGTTLFRFPRTLSPNPPLLFRKPVPLKPLRFLRCSSSAAVDSVTAENDIEGLSCVDQSRYHPWPEWVSFVDRLKTKGYLTDSYASSSSSAEAGDGIDDVAGAVGVTTTADSVYRNMPLLKNACLRFARDRYDIFKSLSEENIQAVVESGCPNLLRKAVNSAKRLRAHVRLDEGDVCSTCQLRGSCDRAYAILSAPEQTARTVDIVRVLLYYALDPLVITGGEKPPGREVIESSTRKLLSELIELSESSPAPVPPKPTTRSALPKEQSLKPPKATTQRALRNEQSLSPMADKASKDVDMKLGDWTCPKCNFMNFSRNMRCLKCEEDKPSHLHDIGMKKGDWICSECRFINFSRNIRCLKCNTEGPKRVSPDEVEKKIGDWNCPKCGFMNFARNKKCMRCPEPKPKGCSGEWNCPTCDFLNFERNKVCLKCNTKHPEGRLSAEDEDHLWRRPN